jgi:hypothetical protein
VIWYQKLKAVHVQYREAAKEETATLGSRSAPAPSMHELKLRLTAILGLIRQGICHQARKGRAPYDRLATQIDEAVNGIGSVSLRRPPRSERDQSSLHEEAALNS